MSENITGIFNTSAFDGSIESDFLNLGKLSLEAKESLINYSAADFTEFRSSLITYLRAVYPDDYNNFVDSDLGIMLVEMFAYLASVLSLKADLLANESYISSVQDPQNLRKLLQLIGMSLKGPISSKASCTLTLSDTNKLTGAQTLTIANASRTFSVDSNRDTGTLSYTLYPVNPTTGAIDLVNSGEAIVLDKDDSINAAGTIFSNLILLEGLLRTKSGSFSTTDTIHTIKVDTPSVVEGSIYVKVGTDVYNEIENLFLADSDDLVFSKVYLDDYSVSIIFGDNVRGKSPSPGTTYEVFYRTGGGTRGNVSPGAINVSIPSQHSSLAAITADVTNPTKATGGRNSESTSHAKKWAPQFFKTQYRAVTGEDYTAFANNFTSTVGQSGKAIAALRNSGAGSNMIDIYVVSFADEVEGVQAQLDRAPITYKNELLTYLGNYKMLTDEVTIVDGLIRTLDIKATIFIDKTYIPFEEDIKRTAATTILNFFDLSKREFGERLRIDELNRELFTIPEIRFSRLNNLNDDIKLNFNEILQLNNIELNVEYV